MIELGLFLVRLLDFYMVILFVRILASWVVPYHKWQTPPICWLAMVTDPVMEPFRRLVPPLGGIDFSPLLLFIALNFLRSALLMLF